MWVKKDSNRYDEELIETIIKILKSARPDCGVFYEGIISVIIEKEHWEGELFRVERTILNPPYSSRKAMYIGYSSKKNAFWHATLAGDFSVMHQVIELADPKSIDQLTELTSSL